MAAKNLVGQVFGTKKVVRHATERGGSKMDRWECICTVCGKVTYPDTRSLRNGVQCMCQRDADKNLTGKVFGDRRVLGRDPSVSSTSMNVWNTVCIHCGNTARISTYDLLNGIRTKCHHKAIFDPVTKEVACQSYKSRHPLYKIYTGMINSCYNPNASKWDYYGAKGVEVCEEWYNPEKPDDELGFQNFYQWAMSVGYIAYQMPSGRNCCRLIRLDGDGPFSPENCEWQFLRSYQRMQAKQALEHT